jgi:hypothetical protein
MFNREAFGDHRLAIVIGARQQEPSGAQSYWPIEQQTHGVMGATCNRMADPTGRPDMGDAARVTGIEK